MRVTFRALIAVAAASVSAGCGPTAQDCPEFKVTPQIGKAGPGTVTFTINPRWQGLTYTWTTNVGTIRGDGNEAVVENVPDHWLVLVRAEVHGLNPSCPREKQFGTGEAQMP